MKHMLKSFLMLAVLSCTTQLKPAATPWFPYHSTSVHAEHQLVGTQKYRYKCDEECTHGFFSVQPGYSRTRKSGDIAQILFGSSVSCDNKCGGTIKVQGSAV
ncbi:MAG: hypothetical protein WBQ73_00825, partial [Candidatus Babeliales bacterium]